MRLDLAEEKIMLRFFAVGHTQNLKKAAQVRVPCATKMNMQATVALSQKTKTCFKGQARKSEADCISAGKQLFRERSSWFAETVFTIYQVHW